MIERASILLERVENGPLQMIGYEKCTSYVVTRCRHCGAVAPTKVTRRQMLAEGCRRDKAAKATGGDDD